MCLLIVLSRCSDELPLVVGANRDERYDRPASSTQVLVAEPIRIVGGRDELAGGTWLAANEYGVVAGLTNTPQGGWRDPTRRSRGELPLLLAGHRDAKHAVDAFAEQVDPSEYNPCWLVVADRDSCFYLDASGAALLVEELEPGIVVLENHPLREQSSKVDHVRAALGAAGDLDDVLERLPVVLGDNAVPRTAPEGEKPNRALLAACVHTPEYGTRSSTIVAVHSDRSTTPSIRVANGAPCTHPFEDQSALFLR